MAVWSEIRLKSLAAGRRLDAEYYQPELLRYEKAVKTYRGGWKRLEEIADIITDGDHLKRNYQAQGVLFLTSEDVSEHWIDYSSTLRIDPEYERTLARARSEVGAVFLTKTGKWYGKAAVCLRPEPVFNISADIAKIRLKAGYDPHFLACYLNSNVGYFLVRRESTGGSRDRIILENLRRIPVPIVLAPHKDYRRAVQAIDLANERAYRYLAEAETFLVSALGLDRLDLTRRLFYERSYKDVSAAGRLDAEYHNPRAQNLIAALSRDRRVVSDVARLATRRFRPVPGVEFQYVEIGDVGASGMAESNSVMGEETPSRAQWIVQPGDVITTTVRPIRRLSAIVTHDQAGYVCSSGLAVLKPTDIEPELLLVYLRLPLVCELLDLHTTASMYPAISTPDLMKFPVSLPDAATRRMIVAKVKESFTARREARRLLDDAKQMVEDAIVRQE